MLPRNTVTNRLLLGLAMALMLCARPARAQVAFNFDEFGNGTVQFPGALPTPLFSMGNIVDPFDPGSGILPLAYNVAASVPGLIPIDGDILLSEPQNPATMSDVLRFYHGLLMVYSDLPEAGENPIPPADVGLPQLFQAQNAIALIEFGPEAGPNGLFGYAPIGGMPGEVSAPSIYNFTSDYAVPEPASLAVIGLGAIGLLRRRRPSPVATPAF